MVSNHTAIVQFLRTIRPDAQLDVREFPSGAFCIDIRVAGDFLVIQYTEASGYGASWVADDAEGFSGHDHVFATEEDVIHHLTAVLSGAA